MKGETSVRIVPVSIIWVLWTVCQVQGETMVWTFGGGGGHPWQDYEALNVMVDGSTMEGAIQPRELRPDENLLPQLKPWYYWQFPLDATYIPRQPRIWRGRSTVLPLDPPVIYVDGDPTTFTWATDYNKMWDEFYTIDAGALIPVEQFVFYPPEGTDQFGEPWANYAPGKFELTASVGEQGILEEKGGGYYPLDILLGRVEQNLNPRMEIRFPLRYLRFLRLRIFPDSKNLYGQDIIKKLAVAEMELYGRGMAPEMIYQSKVVDLGRSVIFGRVLFGVSTWRREDGQTVAAPEAPAEVRVQIKAGTDDTPLSYFTYTDQGELREVTRSDYENLRPRLTDFDPAFVGWRGPVAEDRRNWSPWSVPLRRSGGRPGLSSGRFFQVRVELTTTSQWEFMRLDSLSVEVFSLLADRVVGEVAIAGEPIASGLPQVPIGEVVDFTYDIRAEFGSDGQGGFDAIRIFTPSRAIFRRLEMGNPPSLVEPDSLRSDADGLIVYLPRRINTDASLRIKLGTTLYVVSTKLEGEVFDRRESTIRQQIEEGNATEEVGTNRLQVLASGSSLEGVIGDVAILPQLITPNQDGRNDQALIAYTLFGVLEANVEVGFYTVAGEQVRRIVFKGQRPGRYGVEWEGVDDAGRSVAPGLYLCRIVAKTDRGTFEVIEPISVIY
jgi:hypothetical protein